MSLLLWLENTPLGEYMRVSAYGYPAMLTLHSIGLAVMVGLSVVLSLRALGYFRVIPFAMLQRCLTVAWAGFAINLVSGLCIFAMAATDYVVQIAFLVKIAFVMLGAIFVALLQGSIAGADTAAAGHGSAAVARPLLAIAVIASWTIAMIAGRLIAYL